MSAIKRFASDESGATAIEYGLLSALIAVAIIGSLFNMRDEIGALYERFASVMASTPRP